MQCLDKCFGGKKKKTVRKTIRKQSYKLEIEERGLWSRTDDGGSGVEWSVGGGGGADRWRKRIRVWTTEERGKRKMEREGKRGECSWGEAEVAGGAEGRVNSAPTRRCGCSEPGTEGSTPPSALPTNPARSAQLCGPDSFRLLCARRLFGFPSLA